MTGHDRPAIVVVPPLAFFAAALLTYLLSRWLPLWEPSAGSRPYFIVIGAAVIALALWINVSGFLAFRRAGTNVNPYKPALLVVRDGPYRFTRNAMYLGMILFVLGLGLTLSTLWGPIMAILLGGLFHWGVVLPEERYMEAKFGEDYRAFLASTRRWL